MESESKVLSAVLAGLEAQRARVEEQIAVLKAATGTMGDGTSGASPKGKGRGRSGRAVSAATRKRLSRKMKAYWRRRALERA